MPPHHPVLPVGVVQALQQSRSWGFLGEGPLDVHVAHAQGFADAAESILVGRSSASSDADPGQPDEGPWMDLGSGGGIPGLVLAQRWAHREAVLLDSNERRARFLQEVVDNQGWGDRVRVVTERAEMAGRVPGLRGSFSLVVARSFGSPPVTAECAAPFLRQSGILIVSEPPDSSVSDLPDEARWPQEGLAQTGLRPLAAWHGEFRYAILRQDEECPDRLPRRVGVPGKRPLYRVVQD
jgi:16S rRNA (guanine527-N7)-methyltransferase